MMQLTLLLLFLSAMFDKTKRQLLPVFDLSLCKKKTFVATEIKSFYTMLK